MNKLPIIIALLFAYNASASSLPDCPSDQSKRYHNCFGAFTVNGDQYVGEFKDNKKHGQGTYTYANGAKYVGEYKDGDIHGQGTYTFVGGDQYVGEFKDNKRNGQGTYTFANGAKYVGEYVDDKMHGQGTYTYPSGKEERGYHMNNEYVPTICENMGLRKGSESYGNCVLELIKEINKDD